MLAHSSHDEFLEEKQKIDDVISQGYIITGVTENLDGAIVEFQKLNGNKKETLQIGNAEARKYFSSIIIKQQDH